MAKPHFSKEPHYVVSYGGGDGGGSSMRFIHGEGAPESDVGQPGDVYLNTQNGDLYENNNGSWVVSMNLRGPQGIQGEQGQTGADGQDGEDGARGPAGTDGQDGADGFPTESQWNDLVARVDALENPEV